MVFREHQTFVQGFYPARKNLHVALSCFRQKWLRLGLVYKFRSVRLHTYFLLCSLRADLQAPLKTFNKRNGNN